MGLVQILKEETIKHTLDDLWEHEGEEALESYLKTQGVPFKKVTFKHEILYNIANEYIIDDPDYPDLEDIEHWLFQITEHDFWEITGIDYQERFNNWFWDQVGSRIEYNQVYHATREENVDQILDHGLQMAHESRSMENRHISSAVFTTLEPSLLYDGYYGDAIFTIDTLAMKRDGFTPEVSREPEFEEYYVQKLLADKLGYKEFERYKPTGMSTGNWDQTVIFYEDIPPKYLKIGID